MFFFPIRVLVRVVYTRNKIHFIFYAIKNKLNLKNFYRDKIVEIARAWYDTAVQGT